MIIDFHTHIFPEAVAAKCMDALSRSSHSMNHLNGTFADLRESREKAGFDYCLNLPVPTKASQVVGINDSMIENKDTYAEAGILVFGGMHPDFEDYKTEILRLKNAGIKGIKIHPAYQGPQLGDIRYKRIIDCASEQDMCVVTHGGFDISIPDHDYAPISDALEILEEVKPTKLVLAHMGAWGDWDNVEKYLCGADCYFDTAFSIGPITLRKDADPADSFEYNMNADQFVRIVRKHGPQKILFGTDSPWENQKQYLDWVCGAGLLGSELDYILWKNAQKLLLQE